MSWRIVVISKRAKLDYQLGYMVVRNEEVTKIHLGEISTVLIESTAVSITTSLLAELTKKKIKVIFCDEKRNPSSELIGYYGSHDTSNKVRKQIQWNCSIKDAVWTEIVTEKIRKQKELLEYLGKEESGVLQSYLNEICWKDETNREGHAAKVYFNLLFGKNFIRGEKDDINISLDYGYSIILSTFNKEIVSKGYITPIGINHKNEYNQFNLSCDLMEPYRPLIDEIVYNNINNAFNKTQKYKLIDVLNQIIVLNNKEQYVSNAIPIYIQSVFNTLENIKESKVYNYEI